MTSCPRVACLFFLAVVFASTPRAVAVDDAPAASARVSRTAIHTGDRFEYRVVVRHSPGDAFVTQDLAKSLVMRPFELLAVRTEEEAGADQSVLRLILTLTCYERPGVLEIPAFSLFYYPTKAPGLSGQGSAAQKDVPTRELILPPYPVNLQTTLVGANDDMRDSVSLLILDRRRFVVPGISAVVLAAVLGWAGLLAVTYVKTLARPNARINREEIRREALASIRDLQQSASDGRDPALYLELSKAVRRYLEQRYCFDCLALTPEEVSAVLVGAASGREFALKVEALLEDCDNAFFGRAASAPAPVDLCERAAGIVRSDFGPPR